MRDDFQFSLNLPLTARDLWESLDRVFGWWERCSKHTASRTSTFRRRLARKLWEKKEKAIANWVRTSMRSKVLLTPSSARGEKGLAAGPEGAGSLSNGPPLIIQFGRESPLNRLVSAPQTPNHPIFLASSSTWRPRCGIKSYSYQASATVIHNLMFSISRAPIRLVQHKCGPTIAGFIMISHHEVSMRVRMKNETKRENPKFAGNEIVMVNQDKSESGAARRSWERASGRGNKWSRVSRSIVARETLLKMLYR